jgi:hypothetical protein
VFFFLHWLWFYFGFGLGLGLGYGYGFGFSFNFVFGFALGFGWLVVVPVLVWFWLWLCIWLWFVFSFWNRSNFVEYHGFSITSANTDDILIKKNNPIFDRVWKVYSLFFDCIYLISIGFLFLFSLTL